MVARFALVEEESGIHLIATEFPTEDEIVVGGVLALAGVDLHGGAVLGFEIDGCRVPRAGELGERQGVEEVRDEVPGELRGGAPALRAVLDGEIIVRAEARRPDLRWPIPVDLRQRLTGARVTGLGRRAKLAKRTSTGSPTVRTSHA